MPPTGPGGRRGERGGATRACIEAHVARIGARDVDLADARVVVQLQRSWTAAVEEDLDTNLVVNAHGRVIVNVDARERQAPPSTELLVQGATKMSAPPLDEGRLEELEEAGMTEEAARCAVHGRTLWR